MKTSQIPVVIGVTGHRDLVPEQIPEIRAAVRGQLSALMQQCPNSSFILLSALATGADTLCAQEALALGMRLICPLPMESEAYAEDFSRTELADFRELLERAESWFPAADGLPRDALYRAAGEYIVDHCHVLLALWDGSDALKDGVGTAAIVRYARLHSQATPVFTRANPCGLIHVTVDRCQSSCRQGVSVKTLTDCSEVLEKTDTFNRDAALISPDSRPPLSSGAGSHPVLERFRQLYCYADSLSTRYQKRYLNALYAMASFCVLLVLAYLLYDELDTKGFLILYGALLGGYAFAYRRITRQAITDKYMHYRMLAEAARIQLYLTAVGHCENVVQHYTWTQKQDTDWIRHAVSAVLVGPKPDAAVADSVLYDEWIQDQLNYHRRSEKKTASKLRKTGRTSSVITFLMIFSFFLVAILEYCFPDFMVGRTILTLLPQGWLKIVWGVLSAVTLFSSAYAGKLSLERRNYDHNKMVSLFETAESYYHAFPTQRMELFRNLAREELIENGNWYSYSRENTPSFDL